MKGLKDSVLRKIGSLAFAVMIIPQFLLSAELDVKIENDFFGGYTLSVSAKNSKIIEQGEDPVCVGAEAEYAGVSRNFSWINGKSSSTLSLQYRIIPAKDGTVLVKPFEVIVDGERLRTKEVSFNAKRHVSRRSIFDEADEEPGSEIEIIPRVEIPEKKYYVGDAVCLRYILLSSGGGQIAIAGLNEAPKAEGFYSKEFVLPDASTEVSVNGKKYRAWTAVNFIFVPLKPGEFDIGGGSVIFSLDSASLFNSFQNRELKFPMKKIRILPLPKGEPEDFSAAVGTFSLSGEAGKTEARVHSEIPVTLHLKGTGNFFTVKDPVAEKSDMYQMVIKGDEPQVDLKDSLFSGIKKYHISLIPLQKGRLENVKIHMSVFDPALSTYVNLEYTLPVYDIVEPNEDNSIEEKTDAERESDPRLIVFAVIAVLLIILSGLIVLRNRKIVRSVPTKKNNNKTLNEPVVDDKVSLLKDRLGKISSGTLDSQESLKILYDALNSLSSSSIDIKTEKEYLDSIRFGGVKPEYEILKKISRKFITII